MSYERGDHVAYKRPIGSMAAWIIDPEIPIIRLVGDDRDFEADWSDISPIDADQFCGGCGQIGCGHG